MEKIKEFFNKINLETVKYNEPLKNYTSFKIGGSAKIFAIINNEKILLKTIKYLIKNKKQYIILGNATNVLVSDNGFNGAVIKLGNALNRIKIKKNFIICDSGVSLIKLNGACYKNSLTGLEFSFGIPGSVGGAVKMNAGAYGDCFSSVVHKVKVFDGKKVRWLKNSQLNFSYRHSIFSERKEMVILQVCLKLKNGVKELIYNKHKEIMKKRKQSHPYDMPSAGSVFKRNEKYIVSKVIDELGLKGYEVGGAQVSTKHAGFIVNKGDATCKDVLYLVKYIQEKVNEGYGFMPELEIELIGDFDDFTRGLSHTHNI